MEKLKFGCVADDFTGASDMASFLVKGGMKTVLFNGVPKENVMIPQGCEAVVIALKTRTQETSSAVEDSMAAADWLVSHGARQLYSKYCSTFDSTPKGNIGPIADAMLKKYGGKYSILCPALPVNGRTVNRGFLYVNGVPLAESSMKDHPLTPMWDSDLKVLMEAQSEFPCVKVSRDKMREGKEAVLSYIESYGQTRDHFYVIPDFTQDTDAKKILDIFGDCKLLTGGSGLGEEIGERLCDGPGQKGVVCRTEGPALLLSGSCSKATLGQVKYFIDHGGAAFQMDPKALMEGSVALEDFFKILRDNKNQPVLIYSSDETERVKKAQELGTEKIASLLETTTAEIAKRAVEMGYTRLVVAGGETSGAVTKALGFDAFVIGESVAPGVPVMTPIENHRIRLVLKSGNFGQEDFFSRALNLTEMKEV